MNKKKIFNDPVYGFISISSELIFDIIQHPYFQRLRRIKQLGLTEYVYPGAHHTRLHHALGAMHLMGEVLDSLRSKGHEISADEYEAAQLAILLHDIGHGPFSHALEASILNGVPHEQLSLLILKQLNIEYNGRLNLAIDIFTHKYHRPFLSELVASQLDIDRLDYLQRDCFFTGVSEGTIGADRIIKMLDLSDEKLVVESKGIYSIENFLNARRLMYWQVYLHKTAVAAEQMLISLFKRAKYLALNGETPFATPELTTFLEGNIRFEDIRDSKDLLDQFAQIDDYDVWGSIKIWKNSSDKVLSTLSQNLLDRKLLKVHLESEPFSESLKESLLKQTQEKFGITKEEAEYFVIEDKVSNEAYISKGQNIWIKDKSGKIIDVAEASDLPNIKAISKIVHKHYLCHPKTLTV